MAITDKERKMLWGRSGNRCVICRHELVVDATVVDDESVVGDECHIISSRSNGPRHDPSYSRKKLDTYENLILLCRVHHKVIDDQDKRYTVNILRSMKANHELWVSQKLADTHKPKSESPLVLEAKRRHFDDLLTVAKSLRFNLLIPNPKRVQESRLPIDDRKYEGLSNLERLSIHLQDMVLVCWPGPKWVDYPDGTMGIQFYTEEFRLFPALMEHLKGTGLDTQFSELKEFVKRYFEVCYDLKDKIDEEQLPNVAEVSDLCAKSKDSAKKVAEELDVFIHSRVFPGRCRFCPK